MKEEQKLALNNKKFIKRKLKSQYKRKVTFALFVLQLTNKNRDNVNQVILLSL